MKLNVSCFFVTALDQTVVLKVRSAHSDLSGWKTANTAGSALRLEISGSPASAQAHVLFFILGLQPPRFRVSLCRRSRVFHFDSSKSSASHRRNGGAQNLRRGHKKPLGAALWMIWHTRCGYSSVDAVMSADYCRFEGCGILKRAFQCGTKPRSNCKTLSIFCAGVRVKVCSKQRSENFFFFAFFFY